jgi:hypothetical protein
MGEQANKRAQEWMPEKSTDHVGNFRISECFFGPASLIYTQMPA